MNNEDREKGLHTGMATISRLQCKSKTGNGTASGSPEKGDSGLQVGHGECERECVLSAKSVYVVGKRSRG